jgi:uncharacterized protein (DUF427 family)
MRATWNDTVLAESDDTIVVEGNHYFPPDDVRWQHLADSDTRTVCHWKGTATYYTVRLDGGVNPDAAWSYPAPSPAAESITGHVAFWRGVTVSE